MAPNQIKQEVYGSLFKYVFDQPKNTPIKSTSIAQFIQSESTEPSDLKKHQRDVQWALQRLVENIQVTKDEHGHYLVTRT